MTAPTGTSPRAAPLRACSSAARIPARSASDGGGLTTPGLARFDSRFAPKVQMIAFPLRDDRVTRSKPAFEHGHGDRILQQPLDDPLERPSAVHRIVAPVRQQ